ncbi:MAG TPA: hypothetical protein VJP86_15715, partial [Vicinamibacterales bacterium]|nr:hypothetical protein [Vicinamibacterales bacterium]
LQQFRVILAVIRRRKHCDLLPRRIASRNGIASEQVNLQGDASVRHSRHQEIPGRIEPGSNGIK